MMCREGENCAGALAPPSTSTAMDVTALAEEAFTCQICLDLVYKPIVQCCGHVFCFWCARLSMNGKRQSQCPVCRRAYVFFPRVCEMLHFYFMKALPEEYRRRAKETEAMEEVKQIFSPRFLDSPVAFRSPHKPDELKRTFLGQLERRESVSLGEVGCQAVGVTAALDLCNSLDSRMEALPCEDRGNVDTVTALRQQAEDSTCDNSPCVEDFSCASCGKFLYRPVALNCGKVFCESCVKTADSSTLACPSCRTHHPGGSIHVCLDLHYYLERLFPTCYSERRKEIEVLERTTEGLARRITDSDRPCDAPEDIELNKTESRIVHIGAGCDGCGMFPILGHRYHCFDCNDGVSYDLCGTCYRGRDSLVCGRFNQPHTPDHRMEEILSEFRWAGTAGAPLNLNLENGIITRRRQQQILIDFEDYIDSFV